MLTCRNCKHQMSNLELDRGRCPKCHTLVLLSELLPDTKPDASPQSLDETLQDVALESGAEEATPEEEDKNSESTDQNPGPDSNDSAYTEQTLVDKDLMEAATTPEGDSKADQAAPQNLEATLVDEAAMQTAEDSEASVGSEQEQTLIDASLQEPGHPLPTVDQEKTLLSDFDSQDDDFDITANTVAIRELSEEEKDKIDENWQTVADAGDINASLVPGRIDANTKTALIVKSRSVSGVEDAPGDRNDYQMLDVLGKGGVGIVYSAKQTSIDRNVAFKILHPKMAKAREHRNKFLTEAVVIGYLDHPQIVPIYDLGKTKNDELFYTMKKVEGTPWQDKIDELSLEDNLDILIKISDAIAFAHHRGIIHRDLKPDNVMLGDFGEVLVMDWGLALVTEKSAKNSILEGSGGLGGTPAYMAPEMVTGPIESITSLSDVYLLGAMLYRILEGRAPHSGNSVTACVRAAASNKIQPAKTTGELINIALKAMASKPEDRYSSAIEFRDALKNYESHAESLKLSDQARKDLRTAEETSDYQFYARSVFGFEEARNLWKSNPKARKGLVRARLAYANAALKNGDFDLGLSLLDRENPDHQELHTQLVEAQTERNSRQRQLQRTKFFFRWATTAFVFLLSIACIVIYSKMKAAEAARSKELIAKNKAVKATQEAKAANEELGKTNDKLAQTNDKLAETNDKLAETNVTLAVTNDKLEVTNVKLEDEKEKFRQAKDLAERSEKVARKNRRLAEQNREIAEAQTYLSQIALAAKKIEENRFDEARETLQAYRNSHLVGWEWGYLWKLCNLSDVDIKTPTVLQDVSSSPNGKVIAVASEDGRVRIWKTADLLDPQNLEQATAWEKTLNPQSNSPLTTIEFSLEGDILAVADSRGIISLIAISETGDATGMQQLSMPWKSQSRISSLKFSTSQNSRDSRWLLAGSESGEAAIWDINRKVWIQFPRGETLRGHRREVNDIAISPDRDLIFTAGEDDKIQIWSRTRRAETETVSVNVEAPAGDVEPYAIWKTVYWMHEGAVTCLDTTVDENGQLLLVSGGEDGSIHLWNVNDFPSNNLTTVPPRETLIEPTNNAGVQEVHLLKLRSQEGQAFNYYLLTCGDDRTIQLWKINTGELFQEKEEAEPSPGLREELEPIGELLYTFRGHGSRVNACGLVTEIKDNQKFSRIVSVGDDQRIMLWDAADYRENQVFEFNTRAQVLDATFDDSSNQIAAVNSKGALTLIDLQSNQSSELEDVNAQTEIRKEGHDFLANFGKFIPTAEGETESRLITAGVDGKVVVWNLDRGVTIREFHQTGRASIISISGDRNWMVTGGAGQSAWLCPLPPSQEATADAASEFEVIELVGHEDTVTSASFSADDQWIFTGDKAGRLLIWKNSEENRKRNSLKPVKSVRVHSEEVTSIQARGNSIITTSLDYAIKIWDIETDETSGEVTLNPVTRLKGTGEVTEAQMMDDRYLACIRRIYEKSNEESKEGAEESLTLISDLTIYDLESDPPKEWNISRRDSLVVSLEFVPQQNWLLLTENSGQVLIWDWESGEVTPLSFGQQIENYCTRLDSSGSRLVTIGGRQVRIWNFDRQKKQVSAIKSTLDSQRQLGPHSRISSVAFSDDDHWIVTGDLNGQVKLWNRTDKGSYGLNYRIPRRTNRSIVSAKFVPGHPNILLTAWEDVLILSTFNGEEWVEEKRQPLSPAMRLTYAGYSPSGQKLLLGFETGICEIWNASNLKRESRLQSTLRHQGAVLCGTFSADEQFLVTGSDDNNARGIFWKFADGKWNSLSTITGHSEGITSVSFSPIHQLRLLTGSRDGTAKLWDISSITAKSNQRLNEGVELEEGIEELLTLRGHDREVTAVEFDRAGELIMTASLDGQTILWSSAEISPIIYANADLIELLPDQPVSVAQGFGLHDPVSPALPGGTLQLSIEMVTDAAAKNSLISVKLSEGSYQLQKSANAGSWDVIEQQRGQTRKIATVSQGGISDSELAPSFQLQIEPGTTNVDLLKFLDHLVYKLNQEPDPALVHDFTVTLELNLPANNGESQQQAILSLRIPALQLADQTE